jgi:transcriptional regulator with AAA-type ATPase domain
MLPGFPDFPEHARQKEAQMTRTAADTTEVQEQATQAMVDQILFHNGTTKRRISHAVIKMTGGAPVLIHNGTGKDAAGRCFANGGAFVNAERPGARPLCAALFRDAGDPC